VEKVIIFKNRSGQTMEKKAFGRGREQEISVPICMEDIPGIDGEYGFSYGKTSV